MDGEENARKLGVTLTGFSTTEVRELMAELKRKGFSYLAGLKATTDVLIAKHACTAKWSAALQTGIPVVSEEWLRASQLGEPADIEPYRAKRLAGLTISCTALSVPQRDSVNALCNVHGGEFSKNLHHFVAVLLIPCEAPVPSTDKLAFARKVGIPVVTVDWIYTVADTIVPPTWSSFSPFPSDFAALEPARRAMMQDRRAASASTASSAARPPTTAAPRCNSHGSAFPAVAPAALLPLEAVQTHRRTESTHAPNGQNTVSAARPATPTPAGGGVPLPTEPPAGNLPQSAANHASRLFKNMHFNLRFPTRDPLCCAAGASPELHALAAAITNHGGSVTYDTSVHFEVDVASLQANVPRRSCHCVQSEAVAKHRNRPARAVVDAAFVAECIEKREVLPWACPSTCTACGTAVPDGRYDHVDVPLQMNPEPVLPPAERPPEQPANLPPGPRPATTCPEDDTDTLHARGSEIVARTPYPAPSTTKTRCFFGSEGVPQHVDSYAVPSSSAMPCPDQSLQVSPPDTASVRRGVARWLDGGVVNINQQQERQEQHEQEQQARCEQDRQCQAELAGTKASALPCENRSTGKKTFTLHNAPAGDAVENTANRQDHTIEHLPEEHPANHMPADHRAEECNQQEDGNTEGDIAEGVDTEQHETSPRKEKELDEPVAIAVECQKEAIANGGLVAGRDVEESRENRRDSPKRDKRTLTRAPTDFAAAVSMFEEMVQTNEPPAAGNNAAAGLPSPQVHATPTRYPTFDARTASAMDGAVNHISPLGLKMKTPGTSGKGFYGRHPRRSDLGLSSDRLLASGNRSASFMDNGMAPSVRALGPVPLDSQLVRYDDCSLVNEDETRGGRFMAEAANADGVHVEEESPQSKKSRAPDPGGDASEKSDELPIVGRHQPEDQQRVQHAGDGRTGALLDAPNSHHSLVDEERPSKVKEGAGAAKRNSSLVLTNSSNDAGEDDESTRRKDEQHAAAAAKRKPPRVLVSSGSIEVSGALRATGQIVSELSEADIVVCAKPSKTVYYLGAVAGGKWVVAPTFVSGSCSAGQWVDPASHEWCRTLADAVDPAQRSSHLNQLADAALVWRAHGGKAFAGWRVSVLSDARTVGHYHTILQCGGAAVVPFTTTPPAEPPPGYILYGDTIPSAEIQQIINTYPNALHLRADVLWRRLIDPSTDLTVPALQALEQALQKEARSRKRQRSASVPDARSSKRPR